MITLNPVRRALVPVDSEAAQRLCSPNYDEFQGDREIFDLIQRQPDSVLKVTMPHCNAASADALLVEGSDEALAAAGEQMAALRDSPLTRVVPDALFLYEIADPRRPGVRQIGVGGMARIDEIRTDATPDGTIIRNEGVREKKARGRADLIRATDAIIGTVNNAIDDDSGAVTAAMEAYADARACDFHAETDGGEHHRIWLVTELEEQEKFAALMAAEPCAYVADGNHRSAAAAMLGSGEFLAVFFPARTMSLAPYNRLVRGPELSPDALVQRLGEAFEVEPLDADTRTYQPERVHEIGLYTGGRWYRLVPRATAYDPANAVQSIDADIVQRHIFAAIFEIADPADERFTFVGGNRDAAYLRERVDAGDASYAVTLAPVTVDQFIDVCRQNRIMPPKSSWFQPKIRSGLAIALLA